MITTRIDNKGRKYLCEVPDGDPQMGAFIDFGPPEGLVDELGIPEPFATRLHNILYDRHVFNYRDVSGRGVAQGIIMELLQLDTQRLAEAFAKIERELL